jgi:hypothetical protein
MKCLCGYSHSPNNTFVLKKHIEDCMVSGLLSTMVHDPAVIWKDGEFQVVAVSSETDQIIDVGWVRPLVSVAAVENMLAKEALKLEKVAEAAETPEELDKAVQEIIVQEDAVQEDAVQEDAVQEEPKPEPKKRAPRKKATTTDE